MLGAVASVETVAAPGGYQGVCVGEDGSLWRTPVRPDRWQCLKLLARHVRAAAREEREAEEQVQCELI